MPRISFRLTDRIVRNLAAPGYHADGDGLYLQVSKAGTKSWVFRFTMLKETHDMGLGSARTMTLAEARARAADCRALRAKGINPLEQARSERKASALTKAEPDAAKPEGPTFREFAADYIDARADTWRNEKHRVQWRTTLAQYAFPVLGDMPLAAIDTPDVLRVLEPIWRDKSETASRVRGRIERILAAAAVRGLRPATNPAAWRGHLREALPPKAKSSSFAALPYAELPAFLAELRKREGVGARALEFVILTAARSGEARGARWSEIDEEAKLWTVPGERMKAGRAHVVPLCDRALGILAEMKPLRDLAGGLIFPGMKRGHLSDMTLIKTLRRMGYRVTAHGFRSTFRDWVSETTSYPDSVAEAALAHLVADKVEAAYRRGDLREKRRALMDEWGAYCTSAPVENVVPMRRPDAAA